MALLQGGPTLEMQQALKNCEAVAGAFKASPRRDAVAITVYCLNALSVKDQAQVEYCLHEFLVEDEEDSGDQGRGSYSRPNWKIPNPLILFVLVPALPKRKWKWNLQFFVCRSDDDDIGTNSGSSWHHVYTDPQTTPDKLSNASVALQSSATKTRTLMCTPCGGLVLLGRYCRAIIGIREISVESLGSINLSEYARRPEGVQCRIEYLKLPLS